MPGPIKQVLTPIFRRIEQIEAQTPMIGTVSAPLTTHLDAAGNKLTNVAPATSDTDVPNFDQVKKYVDAAIKRGLM